LAEHFHNFFVNAVSSLDLNTNIDLLANVSLCDIKSPIDIIISKYRYHPSILKIREMASIDNTFKFNGINLEDMQFEIMDLQGKKATPYGTIPAKPLKDNLYAISPYLLKLFNESIETCLFPNELKLADISPIFKSGETVYAKNYRPVSVISTISKIFERCMHKQLSPFVEKFLSPNMCGYRKGYNAQYAMVSMLENMKKYLDKGGFAGAMLMDLSKAFDTINHELLLAKLHAYNLDINALVLIQDYLSNRKQRVKIETSFSSWSNIEQGVPQGSGPILFSIYINDIFWFNEKTNACSFADDTTLYKCNWQVIDLIKNLEHSKLIAVEWFGYNFLKLNKNKCHFIFAGHYEQVMHIKIGNVTKW